MEQQKRLEALNDLKVATAPVPLRVMFAKYGQILMVELCRDGFARHFHTGDETTGDFEEFYEITDDGVKEMRRIVSIPIEGGESFHELPYLQPVKYNVVIPNHCIYVVDRGIEITTQRPEDESTIMGEFDSLQEAEEFVFNDTTPLDE